MSHVQTLTSRQMAYLMADISNVRYEEIKDISESLEALSCKSKRNLLLDKHADWGNFSTHHDKSALLRKSSGLYWLILRRDRDAPG